MILADKNLYKEFYIRNHQLPTVIYRMNFIVKVILCFLLFNACKQRAFKTIKITGEAQGTTYQLTYLSEKEINYKAEIDSLLKEIDSSLSTYVPASLISRINKNDSSAVADRFFKDVFIKAIEVSEKTGGLFDVTVAPVVNAWGFGFTKKEKVDSAMIDSLLGFIGYKMVKLEGNKLVKQRPEVLLDFNAIAQGYTVDVLAAYLEGKGIGSYLVELGGEVKGKGKKVNNEYWKVGIDKPDEILVNERGLQAIIGLKDAALATSGNYRKFYIEDGKKYSHIINPFTGYPAKNNLLSATVMAEDCMTADAYATAFMVMGLEKAKQFLVDHKNLKLEVFFIYDENGAIKTYTSPGLKERTEELQ